MSAAFSVTCPTAEATQSAAAAVAGLLEPGDVVLLDGELGAGKTTFTQGLARALGAAEAVTSPTFTLVHSYPTTAGFDLLHVDVYRLERLNEIVDLALPEQIEDGAVAVIEWGGRAAPALAPDYLRIDLSAAGDSGARVLDFDHHGSSWKPRWSALADAVTGASV